MENIKNPVENKVEAGHSCGFMGMCGKSMSSCPGCGQMDCMKMHRLFRLAKVFLVLIVICAIFSAGVRFGELKGFIESNRSNTLNSLRSNPNTLNTDYLRSGMMNQW